jgi:hypothetical protein
MPVATAAFFATRFSFAPVLRTTPCADLLVFFDEDLDFLRLAFFMDSSRSTWFVQLGSFYIQRQEPCASHFCAGQLTKPAESGGAHGCAAGPPWASAARTGHNGFAGRLIYASTRAAAVGGRRMRELPQAAASVFSATSTRAAESSTFFVAVFRLLAVSSNCLKDGRSV